MLTSKEIIERTGISRATLNNYIASGLVPRPQVLPPGPEHGAAPRIGFFPDDTITRIETIQRLKREGWSIARITEQLAGESPAAGPQPQPEPARPAPAPAPAVGPAPVPAPPQQSLPLPLPETPAAAPIAPPLRPAASLPTLPSLTLPLHQLQHAAYVLDERLAVLWSNEAARAAVLVPATQGAGSVLPALLAGAATPTGEAILRLHLQAARARSLSVPDLAAGLGAAPAARLQELLAQAPRVEPRLVVQAAIPASGAMPARQLVAVQYREGILFAWLPAEPLAAPAPTPATTPAPAIPSATVAAQAPAAPQVTPVAVLVGTLQDAAGLWVKLSAQEYFELVNEVWAELDRILRQNHASPGRTTGELLVSYFLPPHDGGHLWNALAAAHQVRESMRQLSHRWQLRKGWDLDLCLNLGIAEGQEWMGQVGAGAQAELRVLGDAADHAEHLAAASRAGAILVTRSLVGKLAAGERQRVSYGVSRRDGPRGEAPLLSTFARLEEIAGPRPVPPHLAGLPVAELLDLSSPHPHPGGKSAA